MKTHKNTNMKKTRFLIALLLLFTYPSFSQDIPDKPVPARLVNDFAGILSRQETNTLEQKLVAFNDSTSTQIAVISVKSLDGYDIADYSQRLAEKWGIGQKGLNNGILVLIKPKTSDSNGEVFIAQGYGLEGVIPDITAAQIIDNEMLPSFRNGDYYKGIDKATSTLMSLAGGEFTADQYGQRASRNSKKDMPGIFVIIFIIIIVMIFSRGGRGGKNRRITSGSNLPFWLLMSMLGSGGRSHGGSWGGFSGGGGGGFGGFGGGSFGGGGARGSW